MQGEILAFLSITVVVTVYVVTILLMGNKVTTTPVPGSFYKISPMCPVENYSTSGYVLVTNFSDQLNSGLRNMMSLQWLGVFTEQQR